MASSPHSVNPLGRAPRRPSSTRRAQFNAGPRKYLGIAHVSLVVLASFASRVAAIGTTVKSITASSLEQGYHTFTIMDDDSLMCWGDNSDGRLGVLYLPNDVATSPVGPVNLGTGRTAKAVSLGIKHTCAILDDDTLKCWGYNQRGQLGYGDTTDRSAPDATAVVNLGAGRTAKAVSAGSSHTCAILDDDTLKCWGQGGSSIGYGDWTQRTAPDATAVVDLGSGRTAKAIFTGRDQNCAILDDDTLKCWGNNDYGQLGYGDTDARGDAAGEMGDALLAINLGSGRTAKAVSAGSQHTCAILDDNTLKCWGRGGEYGGMLGYGDNTQRKAPEATAVVNLGSGRTAKAISVGYQHTCAILDDDTVKCWGYNNMYGAVGVGSSDKYVWDPTEVKFDGSSSSGGSAGSPGSSGLNGTSGSPGTSGAPGSAGPKGDERTFTVAAAALIVAVIWPVVLVAYLVRQRNSSPRATKAAGAKPRLFDQPIDVESRL